MAFLFISILLEPELVSVSSALKISALVFPDLNLALPELMMLVILLKILLPIPSFTPAPFFSSEVIPLYVAPFNNNLGATKFTSPLKTDKGPRAKLAVPSRFIFCAVVPTCVKSIRDNIPVVNDPGPLSDIVNPSPNVTNPLALPNNTPRPLVLLTVIFPLMNTSPLFPIIIPDPVLPFKLFKKTWPLMVVVEPAFLERIVFTLPEAVPA